MPETLTDAQKVLRNDTGKRIAVALEALASEVDPSTVIAPEYDAAQTYAVGDLVMYRSVLYRCTTAITTPEEWTAAHWTATSVSDAYRQAVDQDAIDANLLALGLSGASVGDLVRVASVDANGKPTSWRKAPLCEIKTNPNLLDNWYFLNAVNQRGQGSYPNPGYCIDRWSKATGGAINSVGPTYGLLVTSGTAIIQAFESGLKSSLDGKVCTLSVAITSGLSLTVYYGTFTYQATPSATISVFSNNNMKGEIGTDGKLYVTWQASFNYGIAAVKLELGTEQTLAHLENGAWVLNEIPDYYTELQQCRYYFRVLESSPGVGAGQYFTAIRGDSDATILSVPVEPPMAKNIVPSIPDGIQGAAIDGAGTVVGLSNVEAAGSDRRFGMRLDAALAKTPIVVYLNKRIYLSAEP